ncbi:MAG: hypothetical protein A2Y77_06975 [Planctomycetes bacterium RBG_13_62_9]|nr:MAG: hypothetical protein A2Y77_06975 [Planctomycetes bacterium RBG_13_62_9]
MTVSLTIITLNALAADLPAPASAGPASDRFTIQVLDRQTGRGVPLVELRTTNSIRYFTDSHGIVAFHEPGLMDRDVFFFVESHGYEFPKDGFGFRGTRLRTTPGKEATIKIDRLNVAERLYRVTGQGIYRDSVLAGRPAPLKNPVLNGQVMGQDSVDTCIYHGRLYWFWGDTGRPSYPLGHFAMAGAVSDLPGHGGLDPAVGVNLEYLVDKDGFSRPLCRLKEPGLVWLDGFLVVKDREGHERMIAKFARLKDLGHALERGLIVFNDSTQSFEPLVRTDPNLLPYPDFGHALPAIVDGRPYYYFALPFPLTVRMRVEAKWDDAKDPNRYEVLTTLQPDFAGRPSPLATYRWVRFEALTGKDATTRAQTADALKQERKGIHFYDVESGKKITPHGGSVYFNAHRQKWVAIFLQVGGESSYIGEVWYAEADTPVGPWAYARKVATHNKYSFYNPKHHPYFDQDGGRTIYFEGTYSWTFSGSEERATPRYDYNQVMYRLNLDDPRVVLPAPVYQVRDGRGGSDYLLGDAVAKTGTWDSVESAAFYAIEPGRGDDRTISVYADRLPDGNTRLTTQPRETPAKLLFHALPPTGPTPANECIMPLYEYRHTDSGRRLYSPQFPSGQAGWGREQEPLCRVWKTPAGPMLLDGKAAPMER